MPEAHQWDAVGDDPRSIEEVDPRCRSCGLRHSEAGEHCTVNAAPPKDEHDRIWWLDGAPVGVFGWDTDAGRWFGIAWHPVEWQPHLSWTYLPASGTPQRGAPPKDDKPRLYWWDGYRRPRVCTWLAERNGWAIPGGVLLEWQPQMSWVDIPEQPRSTG